MVRVTMRGMLFLLLTGAVATCASERGGGSEVDTMAPDIRVSDDLSPRDSAPGGEAGATDVAAASETGDGLDAVPPRDAAPASDVAPATDLGAAPDGGAAADGTAPDVARQDADASAPFECPPPPVDFQVTVRAEGRFHYVDAFPAEGLAPRAIRIFLPADYDAAPARRHPVVYLHDGQNLFDPADAAFGEEWEVDEVVDALVAGGEIPPVIVVGVDNTADRLAEYQSGPDPTADDERPSAAYRTFLAERLKPWVDGRYRTSCGRSDTVLIGSSMGGVASIAHALRYPEVWGRIGALSTAFWYSGYELTRWLADHAPLVLPERVWLDVGTAESTTGGGDAEFVVDTRGVRDRLRALGFEVGRDLGYLEDIGAIHNEREWARRLPDILRFLLGPAPTTAPEPLAIGVVPFAANLLEGSAGTELAVQAQLRGLAQTLPNDGCRLESGDAQVATVRADGHVTPIGPGEATLTARRGDLSASTTITVGGGAFVTFRVRVPADTPAGDTIFVAGDLAALGAWDGHGLEMAPIGGGRWESVVSLPPGTAIAYKYTRGSWETVEKGPGGEEVGDRTAAADAGLLLEDEVARWADR